MGSLVLSIPPREAIRLGERILVIHDYRAYSNTDPAKNRNLIAYSTAGQQLWVAENPSKSEADVFLSFVCDSPLQVWNYACFVCTIDPETGRLIDARFTK
jgi:hypothetical protein